MVKIKAGDNDQFEQVKRYEGLQEDLSSPVEYESLDEDVVSVNAELANLAELMKDLSGAPDLIQLETWQQSHGRLYLSTISGDDSDLFIFRSLKRLEHKSIDKSGANKDQTSYEDAIVRRCLLFPHPTMDFIATSSAGTVPTLYKQIMHHSGYIPEHVAITLVKTI